MVPTQPTASSRPMGEHSVAKAAIDSRADLLKRLLPLMSRHAASYAPDSYALWYEYVRGGNNALRTELNEILGARERLSHQITFELHRKHLSDGGEESVRKAGGGMLELMSSMRTLVESARSETDMFDAQLATFAEDILASSSAENLIQRIDSMRSDIDRVNSSMSTLKSQLALSHHTVASLQNELTRARKEASLDPLTGILNRRGFDAEVVRMCCSSDETGEPLCLVVVDIDHFKKINDTYGHPFGDKVIRAVGQTLSQLTQRKDVAARYGGEEFALLLPETPLKGAREVADRIRLAISRGKITRNGDGSGGNITISAGVAEYVRGEDSDTLIARADRALYVSKQGGRNRVSVDQ